MQMVLVAKMVLVATLVSVALASIADDMDHLFQDVMELEREATKVGTASEGDSEPANGYCSIKKIEKAYDDCSKAKCLDMSVKDPEALTFLCPGNAACPLKDPACWEGVAQCQASKPLTIKEPCCESNISPHLKDENGNYVKHVHWEDTWAWAILQATLASKPLCEQMIAFSRGWVADSVKICPNATCPPIDGEPVNKKCHTTRMACSNLPPGTGYAEGSGGKGGQMTFPSWGDASTPVKSKSCDGGPIEESKFSGSRKVITDAAKECEDALDNEADRKAKCMTLFKLGVESSASLYNYFDGTYPDTKRGFEAEQLQARLQNEDSLFQYVIGGGKDFSVKDKENTVHNFDLNDGRYESTNFNKKGRASRCKAWYNLAVAGDAGVHGSHFRVERMGGLSSDVFDCKIKAIDMNYEEKYSMGKNNGCRGVSGVAGVFRACEAPFVMGISGTILHQMRTAYGAGVDFTTEAIMMLMAGLILGGHHTMTELGITGMYFSKWQKDASGMKVGPPPVPENSNNQPSDADTNDSSMAFSNGEEYTAYVRKLYALGSALFEDTFDSTVKGIAVDDKYGGGWPTVNGAPAPMLPKADTLAALKAECSSKTLYELVGEAVPFWTDGQSPVGRTNSCTAKTSPLKQNDKSATEMYTALQQSKQEQDPASLK